MKAQRISHYTLSHKLGAGTYGVVYEGRHAHDPDLRVAVKVVHATLATDDEFVAALRAECRVLARLSHSGIVAFRDLVLGPDHAPAMVLELLEGRDLHDRIQDGPLSIEQVVDILEQGLRALAHAHDKGVVHRDIKPSNLFLCADGATKLLDFGIARAADDSRATKTGQLVGTLDYIPAEVWGGAKADAAADVYAFGLVAWEMLVGHPACARGSMPAKMGWHLTGELADPRIERTDCPAWLADLVASLAARDRSVRPADGAAALDALRAARAPIKPAPPATAPARPPVSEPLGTVTLDYASLPPTGDASDIRPSGHPETVTLDRSSLPSVTPPTTRPATSGSAAGPRMWPVVATLVVGIGAAGIWSQWGESLSGTGASDEEPAPAAAVPAAPTRLEQIQALEARLQQGSLPPEDAATLVNLSLEEGETLLQAERQACLDASGGSLRTCPPTPAKDGSGPWFDRVIEQGNTWLSQHSNAVGADTVRFHLARALETRGDPEAAVEQYRAMLSSTATPSAMLAAAYARLGDFFFDRNDANRAATVYQKAVEDRSSPDWTYTAYKLAWVQFNMGDYARSISMMQEVVEATMDPHRVPRALELPLRRQVYRRADLPFVPFADEALADLVFFYASMGQVEEAVAWFGQLDQPALFYDSMGGLAAHLKDMGKVSAALRVYQILANRDRNHPLSPVFHGALIDLYAEMGIKDKAQTQTETFLWMYDTDSSWALANATDADALATARALMKRYQGP